MGNQATALSPGVRLVTDSLAAYRLTILVTQDRVTEPARVRIRERLGIGAFDFVTCPWCTSVWLAAGVVAARTVVPRLWEPLGAVLAFSAVAGFLAERT